MRLELPIRGVRCCREENAMNRRQFVTALGLVGGIGKLAAQAPPGLLGGAAVRPDWLARHTEPILEPDLPIIDPHHHLWIRPGSRYLADDLLADINSGHNVIATVYVQAQSMYRQGGPSEMRPVGETEFVNGVAAMFASGVLGRPQACAGIVGHADLTLGSRVEPVLLAHLRTAGDRFRGIRHIASWDADTRLNNPDYRTPPALLLDRTFREGVAVLARLGLSFDAMVYHPQLDEVADLAAAFPALPIVLNHCGVPMNIGAYAGRHDEVFTRWSTSLRRLASHENISVKVGGLGMRYTGLGFSEVAEPPSSEMVAATCRPYFETCIEVFGPSRCMFESNFPVDKPSYSYQVFWNACKKLVSGVSPTEKEALFGGTAKRVYRLDAISLP
jgi:predicted TIM-barrel fold metal-dependent hydrolase